MYISVVNGFLLNNFKLDLHSAFIRSDALDFYGSLPNIFVVRVSYFIVLALLKGLAFIGYGYLGFYNFSRVFIRCLCNSYYAFAYAYGTLGLCQFFLG